MSPPKSSGSKRAQWRETPVELKHSGSIARKEMYEYSDAELMTIIGSALNTDEVKAG
jgi:hypothetical protein